MTLILQERTIAIPGEIIGNILGYFGAKGIDCADCSFALMVALPGWSEPFQRPEFDEIVYTLCGKYQFAFQNLY